MFMCEGDPDHIAGRTNGQAMYCASLPIINRGSSHLVSRDCNLPSRRLLLLKVASHPGSRYHRVPTTPTALFVLLGTHDRMTAFSRATS